MSLVINTNVAALNGQRNLAATQASQAQTFQRLSTGLRVNSAKDDAGGLYLAQSQTKDIRGLGMATRNAGDGISMAQTAEGNLAQIGTNLQRINELAIQSSNGTYNTAAREGLQKEVDALTQEIKRIVESTEFNGQKLLNDEAKSLTLQVSFKDKDNSQISVGLQGGIIAQDNIKKEFTWAGLDDTKTFQTLASAQKSAGEAGKAALTALASGAEVILAGKTFSWSSANAGTGAAGDFKTLNSAQLSASAAVKASTDVGNALESILKGTLTEKETIDISTQVGAQVAITQTRQAIDVVSELRATFGAVQNRFEAVISGNQIYSENLQAARSRIQDADFATETSNLAKNQVLQQAGVAALGQANASSQVVLGLL
ncbi:MAG: flagellin [Marinospirillum sp.]|uniref:flagellin N-terminal helical domain-containing protein n=1 Tax=Marinospirillum sp. TaxID=2183934 RepID=UPI0019F435CB|nr:flagellin [Marinospirillum sp.]MBE0507669.1 flagellin [Marinospirillum sp.]